jgi:archaellum component FlaC
MSGKEIINGMDQVIQYIQNQDKKIKELQEENEELQETIKKMSALIVSIGARSIIETWVVKAQIDPHLLIANADEIYEKVEGEWRVIDEDPHN